MIIKFINYNNLFYFIVIEFLLLGLIINQLKEKK